MLYLLGDYANVARLIYGHRESGYLCCVTSSIGIFGGAVYGSGWERGAYEWGKAKIVRAVLPIAPIQLRRYALYGGSTRVSGMLVAGVVDVASGGREG